MGHDSSHAHGSLDDHGRLAAVLSHECRGAGRRPDDHPSARLRHLGHVPAADREPPGVRARDPGPGHARLRAQPAAPASLASTSWVTRSRGSWTPRASTGPRYSATRWAAPSPRRGIPGVCTATGSRRGSSWVSPAGGRHNLPIYRGATQLALAGTREPLGMVPIGARDYLRYGILPTWQLFRSMLPYPVARRLSEIDQADARRHR